jgi:uncharacterized protein (DUF1810 family)
MARLDRFIDAQNRAEDGFDDAVAELRAGEKRGHWIWYIFPQVAGLGMSAMSQRYALEDLEEAVEYLGDPVLHARLLAVTTAVFETVNGSGARPLDELMGSSIDARKLVSSLTLFQHAARRLQAEHGAADDLALSAAIDGVLAAAAIQGYPPCGYTLQRIGVDR